MKVYDTPIGPYPARVRIALAEKGLAARVEFVKVDLRKGEHKQDAFRAINFPGTVPVLELDDGTRIAECTAITEYLDNLEGIKPGRGGRRALFNRGMGRASESGDLGNLQRKAAYAESYAFWKSKGMSDHYAAAMVAMEDAESKGNTGAIGDGGAAHGLFQHHADRRADIERGTGIVMGRDSHARQLEGAWWELTKGRDQGAREAHRRMMEATSRGEAVAAAVNYFERPRNKQGEINARTPMANRAYDMFGPHVAKIPPMLKARPMPPMPEHIKLLPGEALGADGKTIILKPQHTSTRGDTNVNHTQNFTIQGGDTRQNMEAARLSASRGQQDLLRNVQGTLA